MRKLKIIIVFLLTSILLYSSIEPVFAESAKEKKTGGHDANGWVSTTGRGEEKAMSLSFDDIFVPASTAYKALVEDIVPATFSGVSYELADGVVEMDSMKNDSHMEAIKSISTAGMLAKGLSNSELSVYPSKIVATGGYIDKDVLDSALEESVEDGTVVVDMTTGTAFKVISETEYSGYFNVDEALAEATAGLSNTYAVRMPQLHELLKEYDIPEQTVRLTPGNISAFAPIIGEDGEPIEGKTLEDCLTLADSGGFKQTDDELGGFKNLNSPEYCFEFPDIKLNALAGLGGINSTVEVLIRGGMALGDFNLRAQYSAFGRYGLGFSVGQEMYLVVTLQAKADGDLKIPLFGFDIWLPGGSISLGVFIIVEVNGDLRIEVEANEYTNNYIGVGGRTFAFVPVSFMPDFDLLNLKLGGDISIQGEFDGRLKLGPMAELKICGLELVGAGAFIGIGVSSKIVQNNSDFIDVRLYGFFDIYITILGKRLELFNAERTILQRKQRNLGKYKAVIDEAFVAPGRVGGRILKQPADVEDPWIPVDDIEYRICIEKEDGRQVRYPKDGSWAKTKFGGEFFQGDGLGDDHGHNFGDYNTDGETFGQGNSGIPNITKEDKISVEFVGEGRTRDNPYKSDPVSPTLPFTDVTLTTADHFNDYVVGSIDPQRMKDWNKDPKNYVEDDRCVWVTPPAGIIGGIYPHMIEMGWLDYYNNTENIYYNPIMAECAWWMYGGGHVHKHVDGSSNKLWKIGYSKVPYFEWNTGHFKTDGTGLIDTRIAFDDKTLHGESGNWIPDPENPAKKIINPYFDVSDHTGPYSGKFQVRFEYGGIINSVWQEFTNTTMQLQFNRLILPVEGSYTKTVENSGLPDEQVIDSMQYDEYIWIINPNGERTVTDEEFSYYMNVQSSADASAWFSGSYDTEKKSGYNLVRTVGDGTSTTMFSQRVTVEWVWQGHPDPARFEYLPHDDTGTTVYGDRLTSAGGEIQINAVGLFPACYLEGAPEGVTIDRDTGILTVAPGLAIGTYTFTIVTVQEYRGAKVEVIDKGSVDPGGWKYYKVSDKDYYLHDPAPEDRQEFTLSIGRAPPKIQPPEQTDHGYVFEADRTGSGLTQQIYTVYGDAPITWSVEVIDSSTPLPDFVSIDPAKGVLSIKPNPGTETGVYELFICAENDEGRDSMAFSINVFEKTETPVVREAPKIIRGPFKAEMTYGTDYIAEYYATGSKPITWSLEPGPSGLPVPGAVQIDKTGKLTVRGFITLDTYRFYIKASNDAGSDSLLFEITVNPDFSMKPRSYGGQPEDFAAQIASRTLLVSSDSDGSDAQITPVSSPGFVKISESSSPEDYAENPLSIEVKKEDRSLKGRAEEQLVIVSAERFWEGEDGIDSIDDFDMTPLNEVTIRWNHPRDAYLKERLTVNGAEFIFWDSVTEVIPVAEPYLDPYYVYYTGLKGDYDYLTDCVPKHDMYHPMYFQYERPQVPTSPDTILYNNDWLDPVFFSKLRAEAAATAAEAEIEMLLAAGGGSGGIMLWLQNSGFGDMNISDSVVTAAKAADRKTAKTQSLIYGPHLTEMKEQKSGSYTVVLNDSTGSAVSGRYFTTLQTLKNMSLTFEQEGIMISFDGKNVKKDSILETTLLDLKYYPDRENFPDSQAKAMMLETMGMEWGEDFAYAIGLHGSLPAMGTFAVTTGIPEGSTVNVYRYEGDKGAFNLIAENLKVDEGGIVTYKSDLLGDHLITVKTIEGAMTKETAGNMLLFIIVIIAAAVAIGAVVFVYLRSRRKNYTGGQKP